MAANETITWNVVHIATVGQHVPVDGITHRRKDSNDGHAAPNVSPQATYTHNPILTRSLLTERKTTDEGRMRLSLLMIIIIIIISAHNCDWFTFPCAVG